MEMTARLTGDAKINTLKNDRQVVNFSVAINDSYKSKESNEVAKVVTYIQCDYWINPGIAQYLAKGTLVELQGRIGVNAYTSMNGDAKASLSFHVNSIKLHGKAGKKEEVLIAEPATGIVEPSEDLPF